jgi:hypothetical protein
MVFVVRKSLRRELHAFLLIDYCAICFTVKKFPRREVHAFLLIDYRKERKEIFLTFTRLKIVYGTNCFFI